ncbi:MAG: ATP-binding protein [Acidobacteriota bacterium]
MAVGRTPFRIGSAPGSDLRLERAGLLPRHAEIVVLGGAHHLIPDPRAGTVRVDGRTVGGGGVRLRHGARIELDGGGIAPIRFLLSEPEQPGAGDRLLTLMAIARAITSSLDLDEVLGRVLDGALRFSGAERGYLFLRVADRLEPWTRHLGDRANVEVSRSVAEEVARTGRPIYRENLADGPGPSVTASIVRLRLQAILCLPLALRGDVIGVVYLDSRRPLPQHQPDLPLLEALAGLAAVAIQNSRLVEERVRAERTLAMGQMAKAIVHDVRSPLTSIRGLADLLLARTAEGDPSRPHLCTIIAEVDRLADLTGDLLQFSREAPPLQRSATRLADLVRRSLQPLGPQLRRAGVRLDLSLDEEVRAMVDPARMLRVLHNVIANALEAMPDGGSLAVGCGRRGDRCEITLDDSGRGMPEEVRRRLFEPFFSHGKRHGTGLGLAIVRKIVEEHGGSVSIDSAPGRGTRVRVDLPAAAGSRTVTPAG